MNLVARSRLSTALAICGAAACKLGQFASANRLAIARISSICRRTVSPPDMGSFRVARSIAWMPLVPS
jgi:hypothetical protein